VYESGIIARPFGLLVYTNRSERGLKDQLGYGVLNGEVPEWLKGADCKSAGYAYVGSNPTLSTSLIAKAGPW
jgi:hypothetical protein